ncbi:Ig-like domain-containing protein, partial [Antribacter sp. KLBMP9083]
MSGGLVDVPGWLRDEWRSMVSGCVVVLFAGALAVLAVTYEGEPTADVDLNDSGVWVTKTSAGLLGRFNYEAQALDGTLLAGSADFDVQQTAQRVLLADGGGWTASPVNPAHLALDGTLRLPVGAQVASGAATTAVLDPATGRLWVLPFDGATSFDPAESEPTAELAPGGALAVTQGGTVLVGVPADGTLYTVPTTSQGVPGAVETLDLPVSERAEIEVSAVGEVPVVLDRTASVLVLPGGRTVEVPDGADARLQQPSAEYGSVVVATPDGLVTQPLGGGTAVVRRAEGSPAAPVQLGDCTYGAWSSTGQVLRDCPGTDRDVDTRLDGVDPSTVLAYRVNRKVIVLNDLSAGTLWLAADEYEKVDDWDLKLPEDAEGERQDSETTTPEQVDQLVVDRQQPNRPPQPSDDALGVRPGRTTVLDVLSNDVDPDGDVMTAAVSQAPDGPVTVDRVLGGKALQAAVPPEAAGLLSFTYTVSDGRGGEAPAQVDLRVVPLTENDAPAQVGEPVLRVAQGGVATTRVLPSFRDPDGDDLVLSSATSSVAGDEVRSRPDGTVEFRDGGTTTGRKVVSLTVTDALGLTVEGRLLVDVVAAQEPPVAVGDHVVVLAGQPVTVSPLQNDTDPNGDPLRLVNVAEQSPAEITPNYAAGTFRFMSPQPGSYDLTYQVSDGPDATTGLVRIDVVVPPEVDGPPVAVPDLVLLPAGGSALVDVLANDTDLAGGVLVVQGVRAPAGAPVTVAVLAHHVLRVTEVRRLDGPVTVEYTVSNGRATAVGQVRVVPVPAPDRLRPPDAAPDEATVRAGDVVTVPVLRNDTHPDGLELAVAGELVEQPEAGEAFVSEETVRFRAPSVAGTYHAVYEVRDPNGQKDSAQLTITVVDGEENGAPQPPDVEARVLSGSSVRIALPLDGVDPDGDHVTLSAVGSAPVQGTAEVVDGYLDYHAAPGSLGADTFTYRVVDTRGAVAEGVVRVGIAPPPQENQPPLAAADETVVRPDRTVAVDVLANDSDPDGDEIALVGSAFQGAEELGPEAVDSLVVVTTPREDGTYAFYYGIQDALAAQATGAVTVTVAADAPLRPPVARDDVVAAGDVTRSAVTVDVLRNDSDPDGLASDLEVSVDGDTAVVGKDGQVTVTLGAEPQLITYAVTDMDGLVARAFLRVPPDGTAPHLRAGLDPLEVVSGEPLAIDITELVVVAEGRAPRLTEESRVTALHGTREVTGPTTMVYTSAAGYVGQAAVTFEVTDASGPDDPKAQVALLTAQVSVVARENLPPVLEGTPVLRVAAGEEAALELGAYATDPDGDPLTAEVTGGADGLSAATEGTLLMVRAEPGLSKGSRLTLPVAVSDAGHPPVPGTVVVEVVASTRPLARANDDVVPDAHQGEGTRVPVLANDANPFPEDPLTVVSASVETGDGTVAASPDGVTLTPSDTFHGVMVVRYRVQDATRDPDREVEGRVQVTVLGRPEAPGVPRVEEVRSGTVVLSWDPPVDNGAEITGYTVRSDRGGPTSCPTTTCTVTGLTNDVFYTFTVTATNEVGESGASPASAAARPDAKPDAPAPATLTFGDSSLTVTWVNRAYTDRSPIECVNLEISPAPADGRIQKTCVPGNQVVWRGLRNGTAYTVRVQAENAAPDPSDWSDPSAAETPAAPPAQPAAPTATRAPDAAADGGVVVVSWTAPANNGDPVSAYQVDVYRGGSRTESRTGITGTSARFAGLDPTASYTFTVTAANKAGSSPASPESAAVVPYGRPDAPSSPSAGLISGDTNGKARVTWGGGAGVRRPPPPVQVAGDNPGPQKPRVAPG